MTSVLLRASSPGQGQRIRWARCRQDPPGVEGDKAIVPIANTGPVIPPKQVHRLFDPFQRLDRTRVDDPHGLGLSIVRASAIAHDATLPANARPQGGLSPAACSPP